MSFKKLIMWAAVLALLTAALASAPLTMRAQSANLLQNPGLNLPYDSNQYANGWGHYRITIPKPDDASALEYSNSADFNAETNPSGKFPQLILEGDASQHIGLQQDPLDCWSETNGGCSARFAGALLRLFTPVC